MKNTILIFTGIIAITTIIYIIGSFVLIADNEMDLYTTIAMFYSIAVGVQATLVFIFLTKKKNKNLEFNNSNEKIIRQDQGSIFCSDCGGQLMENSKYCQKCGKKLV